MQVNPNPPKNQALRSSGLRNPKGDLESGATPTSRRDDRFDTPIDGVLLNGQQTEEYNSIQQQLQEDTFGGVRYHNPSSSAQKPLVGSEEWYKIRKENHKEVERRRRETINKGIDELAKVVPDCDKHKGQILSRTLEYIKKLKDNENQYLEKLTLEKLVAEQVISELNSTNAKLKGELEQAWKEVEHWKRQSR